jgi:hypothetical protein
LWKEHFIIDNTILFAVPDNYIPINGKNYTEGLRNDTLDLYTGFPYERGRSADVIDITLLDQWLLHIGTFNDNYKLFPPKTRDNFHGCQFRVANFRTPTFYILTGNST